MTMTEYPERFVVEYQQVHDRIAPSVTDGLGVPRWLSIYGSCASVEAAESLIERSGQHPRRGTYRRYRIVRQVGFAQRPESSSAPGTWWFREAGVVVETPWPDDVPEDAVR